MQPSDLFEIFFNYLDEELLKEFKDNEPVRQRAKLVVEQAKVRTLLEFLRKTNDSTSETN